MATLANYTNKLSKALYSINNDNLATLVYHALSNGLAVHALPFPIFYSPLKETEPNKRIQKYCR